MPSVGKPIQSSYSSLVVLSIKLVSSNCDYFILYIIVPGSKLLYFKSNVWPDQCIIPGVLTLKKNAVTMTSNLLTVLLETSLKTVDGPS